MAWREYLNLYLKYEGDLGLATERELEHANRGMDPELAKRLALADYNRKERTQKNESDKNKIKDQEAAVGDDRFADRLF